MNRKAEYASVVLLSLLTCSSGVASDKELEKKVIWENIGKLSVSRLGNLNRFLQKRDKYFYGFDYLDRKMESPSYRGPIPPRQFTAFTDCEEIKDKLLNEIGNRGNNKEEESFEAKAVDHYYSFCYLQREAERETYLYSGSIMHDLWKVMFFNEERRRQGFYSLHEYAMSLFVKLKKKKIDNARLKKTIESALLGYFLTRGMRTLVEKIIDKYDKNILSHQRGFEIVILAKAELAFYQRKWYEAYIWYDMLIQDINKTRSFFGPRNYAIYMSAWCCYKLGYFDESSLYFKSVSGRSGDVTKATLIDSRRLYSANARVAISKDDPFPYSDPLP